MLVASSDSFVETLLSLFDACSSLDITVRDLNAEVKFE